MGSIQTEGTPTERKFPHKALACAVCAACVGGTFQYGYNVSIINAPTQSVQKFINQTWLDRYQTEIPAQALTLLWSTVVSIFTLGGLVGVCIGGTLSVKKGSLLVNNVFAIAAALLMGLSQPAGSFELLIVGRFVIGINAGEIAPTELRGTTSMGTAVFITGGILSGQVIGLKELLGDEQYWPILLSTTCIPAIMQLLFLPFFPESPRYLLIDRGDEAACDNGLQAKKPWELFRDRSLRWQLLTIVVINSAQQLNGINAGVLIDRLGRKALIVGGYFLMCVCCVAFTLSLTFQDTSPVLPYVSMACIFAFILSFGGVTSSLNTELFTQTSRPAAYVICGTVSWLSFLVIGMVFPFIVTGLQQYSFMVFLVVCCSVGTFIFFVVPETKGKTFLEIHQEFQSKDQKKKSASNGLDTLMSTPL
ncbi:hypothetical protein NHX12_028924 [Muraenolepis orangiensis]|uniref:Major facilitator superfamily (MFS) profile domain-containing protein n=1 Tax=Muraenolepis orangiensis TaxID=630683 RepID=A0A9Q0IN63_9TELE|nr:hypothetical protein NHX12_028924 [Muraenolepis orangiensis]